MNTCVYIYVYLCVSHACVYIACAHIYVYVCMHVYVGVCVLCVGVGVYIITTILTGLAI